MLDVWRLYIPLFRYYSVQPGGFLQGALASEAVLGEGAGLQLPAPPAPPRSVCHYSSNTHSAHF